MGPPPKRPGTTLIQGALKEGVTCCLSSSSAASDSFSISTNIIYILCKSPFQGPQFSDLGISILVFCAEGETQGFSHSRQSVLLLSHIRDNEHRV